MAISKQNKEVWAKRSKVSQLDDLFIEHKKVDENNQSPYAGIRKKLTSSQYRDFIENMTEDERKKFIEYFNSPTGQKEYRQELKEDKRNQQVKGLKREKELFDEKLNSLIKTVNTDPISSKRLLEARSKSFDSLVDEILENKGRLPEGYKVLPAKIANKSKSSSISEKEKDLLIYTWAHSCIGIWFKDRDKDGNWKTLTIKS